MVRIVDKEIEKREKVRGQQYEKFIEEGFL